MVCRFNFETRGVRMPPTQRPHLFASVCAFGLLTLASACGSQAAQVGVSVNPDVAAATGAGQTEKTSTCLEPAKVVAGVEYTCADGKKRKGLFVSGTAGAAAPACSRDNEQGCLTTADFSAFARVEREKIVPGRLLAGFVLAGVTGNVTLPTAASVLSSATFGAGGVTSGTLATCSAMSRTGCYAGVGWTGVEAAQLVAGVVKNGTSLGGVTGDYPSATYPLPGASGTDLPSLSASVATGSYQFWQKDGTRVTGSISDAGTVTPGVTAQNFSASLYRQFSVAGDAALLAGNIKSGATIFSVPGNVTLPAATDVKSGVQYGVAGNGAMGSYTGAADCTADGDTNCKIPSSGSLKAADTANFGGWDIRKKRNQTTGAVLTFAGIAGQSKHCRNRANITNLGTGPWGGGNWNNTTSPAAAGLDVFDTIDDANNGLLGLPSDIPAWTMINAVDYGADYACGGIYATGSVASGETGADDTLAHDANGNWQDLTPMIVPGGATSTGANITVGGMSVSPGTVNGCNATDKHCVFKELISGLMVTEISASALTWQQAIDYCDKLGETGGAITSPIPVIGGGSYSDWRLPTQKELQQLSVAGVKGLSQTSALAANFGNINDFYFWSSSSASTNASNAWYVYLGHGYARANGKTATGRAVCVR
jgi:Protein of unknown function (DUF1566)